MEYFNHKACQQLVSFNFSVCLAKIFSCLNLVVDYLLVLAAYYVLVSFTADATERANIVVFFVEEKPTDFAEIPPIREFRFDRLLAQAELPCYFPGGFPVYVFQRQSLDIKFSLNIP